LSKNDFNSTCEVHKKENGVFQSALFQNRNLVTEITQSFIVFKLKFKGIKKEVGKSDALNYGVGESKFMQIKYRREKETL
jgi:hypothetical protein